jgi:hypothetical protein
MPSSDLRSSLASDVPQPQVTKLVREIEVSHWGNIYVEESYEIVSGCDDAVMRWTDGGGARGRGCAHAGWPHVSSPCAHLPPSPPTPNHQPPTTNHPLQINAGAEHKGAFSRLRHAYAPSARANSFQVGWFDHRSVGRLQLDHCLLWLLELLVGW